MGVKLIKGGTVVNANHIGEADVLIEEEKIVGVISPQSEIAISALHGDTDIIDASGMYVIPGGVDAHVHLQLPMSPEATSSDTFASGTAAAAWGGTTTVIDFAGQIKGTAIPHAIETRLEEASGQCAIDYAFHLSVGDVNNQSLIDLSNMLEEGISSYKLFMAYPDSWYSDDGQILQVMQLAADTGAMIMMHAENGIAIDVLRDQAFERGATGSIWHGRTRPPELEGEAAHRAIQLAVVAGSPLYIVHLSSSNALNEVARARNDGKNVFAETCPQYLYLSLEEHLDQPGIDGVRHICSPPLRKLADGHQDSLWKGLRTDDLSVVATDHCPFCDAEKRLGIDDFRQAPNGLGVIEHRMDLLFQGVLQGEISLQRWVEICSTTPARLFGLQGKKGVIAPGADADIVIYDPKKEHVLGAETHHMAIDHSAWEGVSVTGQAISVLSRGNFVVQNRQFVGEQGHGKFLKRNIPDFLR
ncbi:MAG: dihydropyrimidinase [Acidimicrobiaceae bacterium]|nr:dihydropyrimidinase [Acidimicrobiaceae bacterium]